MNFFDGLIREVKNCLEGFERKNYPYAERWEDVGRNTLVLKRDEAFELSGTGFNLVTSNDIGESGVTVIGNDLGEIKGETEFARISLIRMKDFADEQEAYDVIRKVEYLKYHYFPLGFMVRTYSTANQEDVRVTKSAVKSGISFSKVGNLLISKYLENPAVISARIVYVTEQSADFEALSKTAEKNYEITETLNSIMKNIPLDCSACNLKPICDEVEGMRELHFKKSKM